MKYKFGLSFKVFSIVFVGFVIVLFFIYHLEVNVHIKNTLSMNGAIEGVDGIAVQSKFQETTGIEDPKFLEYIDSTRSNDDTKYTLLLKPNFDIALQKQDHLEKFSTLSLLGTREYKVKLDTLSKETREAIVDALQKTDIDDTIAVEGIETMSNHYVIRPNGVEERVPDEQQTMEIEPTYLKIGTIEIFGNSTSKAITALSFQYYSDDTYMINNEWLGDNGSYYRSIIHKQTDIEQQIPTIIQKMKPKVELIGQPDVHYYNYEKVDGKHYQYAVVPLIKIDNTRDWYDQEIQGYYMKVFYWPTVEKMVSSEYLDDNMQTYAIALAIVTVISILCSYMIVKPIKKIEHVAKQIANNDFEVQLPQRRHDELGSLSTSINSMSTHLKETITNLETKVEEVTCLEKTRKEFIANFTHEMKTPLAIINGYSELIEETKEHLEIQKYLAIIDEQTVKINELVQAMLHLSKLEAHQVTLQIEEVDIEDIVTKCLDTYGSLLKEKEVIICLSSTNSWIQGDKKQLETAITNFIDNALYHVYKQGKIYIIIDSHGVSIENEGNQIETELLNSIWDAFQTGSPKGTGLGLSICKNILELHQFKYGVENTERGVKFYFYY